jgi:16S rRNA G1207 methylase RsmC
MSLIDPLVTRTVDFRYRRKSFRFSLSQALFSSAQVDAGTRMLLAMIAAADLPYRSVADLGSGTGTLGIALAGASEVPLRACDRDALAVAFTAENARTNGIALVQSVATVAGLDDVDAPDDGPELVVSNLPAKAGEPVLMMVARQMAARAAASHGWIAYVLVRPLEDLGERIAELAGEVIERRANANHVCYLVRPSATATRTGESSGGLDPAYMRTRTEFTGPRSTYTASTVHNLPEFDGLGFRTALAFDLMTGRTVSGPWMLYGCGQGHLAVGLHQVSGRRKGTIVDRDCLALAVTRVNLRETGAEDPVSVASPWIPTEPPNSAGYQFVLVNDDPVAGTPWVERIIHAAHGLTGNRGQLLVVSRSTPVTRIEKAAGRSLRLLDDRRMHGFRAALFQPRD